jgi:hypothetical protein
VLPVSLVDAGGLGEQQERQQQQQQRGQEDPYDSAAVRARTHAWEGLLQRLQDASGQDGELTELVYLKHAAPAALPFNPFDLEVGRQQYLVTTPTWHSSYIEW